MGLEEALFRAAAKEGDIGDLFTDSAFGIISGTGKLRTEDDDGVVAHLFGIPVGFQFGTAAGLTGAPAVLVDILSDPTTYLGGIGVLGKTGRAARAGSKWFRFTDEVAGLRGVSIAKRAKMIEAAGRVAHRVSSSRLFNAAQDLKNLSKQDALGLLKKVEKLHKMKLATAEEAGVQRAMAALAKVPDLSLQEVSLVRNGILKEGAGAGGAKILKGMAGRQRVFAKLAERAARAAEAGDVRQFSKLAKQLEKTAPTVRERMLFSRQRRRDLEALVQEREVVSLSRSLAEQSRQGQRSAIKLQVPFTRLEKSINIPGQTAFFGALDKAKDAFPALGRSSDLTGLVRGARLSAKTIKDFSVDPGITPETIGQLAQAASSIAIHGAGGIGNPENDFRAYHEIWIGERLAGKDASKLLRDQLERAFPTVEARFRLAKLLDEPGRYTQTGDLFGPLKQAAKKKGYTDFELEVAQNLKGVLDETGDALQAEGVIAQVVEHYAPRSVRRVKKGEAFQAALRAVRANPEASLATSPHFLERTIPFLRQLQAMEKKGIIELEKDFAKLMGGYFDSVSRAMADRRFIQSLERANWVVHNNKGTVEETARVMVPLGRRVKGQFRKSKKAQKLLDTGQYVTVTDMTPLMRHAYRTADGRTISPYAEGVVVHEKAAKRLRSLFARGLENADPGKVIVRSGATPGENLGRTLLALNGIAKRGSIAMPGLFHFNSLTASATATIGWPFLTKVPEMAARAAASPFIMVARSLGIPINMRTLGEELRAMQTAFPANDIIERAAKAGLQTGGVIDVERDLVIRGTRSAAEKLGKLPVAGSAAARVARSVGDGIMTWDRFLWDSAHSGYKLWAFSELYHAGLQKFPHLSEEKIAKSVADHVNNAFGGQIFEKFFLGRRGQQWARVLLLAPDWTISNVRIATDVFANWFLRGARAATDNRRIPGRVGSAVRDRIPLSYIQSADVRAYFARRYALRVGFINYVMAQMANFAMSGQWMDENPDGHQLDIATPFESNDGRRLYWSVGKQFKEPFQWAMFDTDLLNYKSSPIVQGSITLLRGLDVFNREVVYGEGGALEEWGHRFGHLGESFLPLGAQRFIEGDISLGGAALEQAGFKLRPEYRGRGGGSDISGAFEIPAVPDIDVNPTANLPVAF